MAAKRPHAPQDTEEQTRALSTHGAGRELKRSRRHQGTLEQKRRPFQWALGV